MLLLAALARGETRLENVLDSEVVAALGRMDVGVEGDLPAIGPWITICGWSFVFEFPEDQSPAGKVHGVEILSHPSRIALNLLKLESILKGGKKSKHLKNGWGQDNLLRVLRVRIVVALPRYLYLLCGLAYRRTHYLISSGLIPRSLHRMEATVFFNLIPRSLLRGNSLKMSQKLNFGIRSPIGYFRKSIIIVL